MNSLLLFASIPVLAQVAIDATISANLTTPKSTFSTATFSTSSNNELLLAFVSADVTSGTNTTVTGVAGGGLTWALVKRTNVQKGTAEIWRAFAPSPLVNVTVTASLSHSVLSSMTVMSFSGVDTSGTNGSGAIGATGTGNANPGAPSATLTTTRNGSLVIGVGNDWDNAINRTVGPSQTLVNQYLAPNGDTYWVQRQSVTTPLSGTSVIVNDTAPTGDRFNFSICEVLAAGSGTATFTISGTISPTSAAPGTTLALTGANTASASPDPTTGNYTFSGLANGSYTVTPSNSGFTFNPSSQAVQVNGNNVSAINFTAQPVVTTWNISGTISPISAAAGTTVALTGPVSANATADPTTGNYAFSGLTNGTYTVTPSNGGFTFNPPSQMVPVSGASVSGVNFTGQAVTTGIQLIQKNVSGNEATASSISASFTTNNKAGNFLIVTGTAARPGSSITISDTAGNTYIPAIGPVTDNVQAVTAYIWYVPNCKGGPNTVTLKPSTADALEIHVSEWSGLSQTSPLDQSLFGTGSGTNVAIGPVNTTAAGELIFGYSFVANTATAGSGFTQLSLVNGDPDEYQIQASAGNTSATFNQPGGGAWAGMIATFRPATPTFSISGVVSPVVGGAGAILTLSGAQTGAVTADASGNYMFSNLPNGSYTVTPTNVGFSFLPVSAAVTIAGTNQTGVNFQAQSSGSTWSISGVISPVLGGSGATVTLSGPQNGVVFADGSGNYKFSGLGNGTYTVTPSNAGYKFVPINAAVTIAGASQVGINFQAQSLGTTWSISGTISPSSAGSGATVSVTGPSSFSVVADGNGNYTLPQLTNGTYTVTPSQNGYSFMPSNQSVVVNGASVPGINFTANSTSTSIALDVNTSKDNSTASTTITSLAFSTSAGSELLLAFIAADYIAGTNTTVTGVSGGGLTWSLVVRTNAQAGTAEIWQAIASTPLSNVAITATVSQKVVSSMTVMSFKGTNLSSAIGAIGTNNSGSGAPTASLVTKGNNSWVLGVGDDYDNAIQRTPGSGQSLLHQFLTPTGDTYWVQKQTSPIPASGTKVSISDTAPTTDRYNLSIVEILAGGSGSPDTIPPTVSMTSPPQGVTVANLLTVSATASDDTYVAGVQLLLDGAPLGSELTAAPYSITWDTTSVTNGSHSLAARAVDSVGLTTTSSPVTIEVDNTGNPAVVGSWSSPVSTPAVAVNLILLQNNKVLFYQDGSTPTVWDYVANTFTNIPAPVDLFCSGHALLSDGRILAVGGYGGSGNTIGISNAEIFDPVGLTWTPVPNMAYKRWYPNAMTLSDGRVLVTAGWQTTSHSNAGISEIYDPTTNKWTQLTNANNPFETYPFMYQLPDGRVIHIGGSEYPTDTDILNLTTTSWSAVDSNIVDGGSATMYMPWKFMKAGSAADSQNVGPSSNTTFVLDMTQSSPTWQQTPSMVYPRSFMNLTMLPDNTVLATGGETDKNGGNISNAVYAAELWSPQTQTWTTMASMHTPREYHGTALLLPDARVLVSGMGADFGNVPDEKSAEFYSPPYLFKGPRPTISQAPSQIAYGANAFVGTPDAAGISSVVLIRTGAVTHFFDQNERFIPLTFTQSTGGLTVTGPVNGYLAPPGYYMLFLVNSSGVPSIAAFVQIP